MIVLLPQHKDDLLKSGITPEVAAAHSLHSLSDPKLIAGCLGWDKGIKKLGACLAIPYLDLQGRPNGHVRLKPDKPFRNKDDKVAKYLGPKGKPNRVYFPLGVAEGLAAPSNPIFITEGEKKAICAQQHGFPCLGLAGVECWSKPRQTDAEGKKIGPRKLIDDLAAISWQDRAVFIVYDSDRAQKPEVQHAESALAEQLLKNRAQVKIITLPPGPPDANGKNAKQGLDDFLMARGADEFRALIASASTPLPPSSLERPVGGFRNYFFV